MKNFNIFSCDETVRVLVVSFCMYSMIRFIWIKNEDSNNYLGCER